MSDHKKLFTPYSNDLLAVSRQGDAREESFYPALARTIKLQQEINALYPEVERKTIAIPK